MDNSSKRRGYGQVAADERVLVAVMNNGRDLAIAQNQGWYRIPLRSAPKEMEFGWLAFYQTKVFQSEGWSVNYLTRVTSCKIVKRWELFPHEANHPRANDAYYRIGFERLTRLPQPIRSQRGRRLVFIPTTLTKLKRAREINDLFHESPLEDDLWEAFKQRQIAAERQWYLPVAQRFYCLDFAIFCLRGFVDVECDGDTWHSRPAHIAEDNERDNALTSGGWSILRFNSRQVWDELAACLSRVCETIHRHGGLITPEGHQTLHEANDGPQQQLSLFQEAHADYGEVVD